MFVRSPDEVTAQAMTMPGATGVTMRLMVSAQDGAPNFAMRLFEVQPGGHTPLHQHNYEHEVMIVEGEADVATGPKGEQFKRVRAGHAVFISANELHQFRNASQRPLKFMCMVPTTFDCGGADMPTPGS
jgi:quercetin dioxygenase-like cupin family protein